MNSYYCIDCDWFNMRPGRSTAGAAFEKHLNEGHVVFHLAEPITHQVWDSYSMKQKFGMLSGSKDLQTTRTFTKKWGESSEDLPLDHEHTWTPSHSDILRRLRDGAHTTVRFYCTNKHCQEMRIEGHQHLIRQKVIRRDDESVLVVTNEGGELVMSGRIDNKLIVNGNVTIRGKLQTRGFEVDGDVKVRGAFEPHGDVNIKGELDTSGDDNVVDWNVSE